MTIGNNQFSLFRNLFVNELIENDSTNQTRSQ